MTSTLGDCTSFTGHYETLRAWVLAPSQAVTRPAGLILVLRRGVPDWLAACSTWLPARDRATSTVTSSVAPAAGDAAVTLVLASMVEQCQQEARR